MSLRSRFLSLENFWAAWERVRRNNGCPGVDGETIGELRSRQRQAIPKLRDAVERGTYRPLPWRQIWIPKQRKGEQVGWRELRVPTVRDRVVQQALLQVLHPVMEPEFTPASFAYRPGRSHLMAVRQVAQWRDRGYEWVLDADIVEYFDRLCHARLLAEVQERVDLDWLLRLIEQWISVGVLTKEGLLLPQEGIPQGAVISPLLANVYLDDFDDLILAAGYRLVRYADDFVVLARSRSQILAARSRVEQWLAGMGLQLHADKTQIADFDRGFRFLGHAFTGDLIVPVRKVKEPPAPVVVETPLKLVHSERNDPPAVVQLALIEALKEQRKPIPPPLFVALGYKLRSDDAIAIESKEVVWIPAMAVLYLIEQGTSIRKQRQRFIVEPPDAEAIEIPIREVESILIFGQIEVTTAVIGVCLDEGIPVIFLSQLGEYKRHLHNTRKTSKIEI